MKIISKSDYDNFNTLFNNDRFKLNYKNYYLLYKFFYLLYNIALYQEFKNSFKNVTVIAVINNY